MVRSEPSDQIAINDRDEEATSHREKRPIARDPYQLVDLHLNWWTRGLNRVHQMRLLSTVDRESYNGRD